MVKKEKLQPAYCKHGHEFTPENTGYSRSGGRDKQTRFCRACHHASSSAYVQKKRQTPASEFVKATTAKLTMEQARQIRQAYSKQQWSEPLPPNAAALLDIDINGNSSDSGTGGEGRSLLSLLPLPIAMESLAVAYGVGKTTINGIIHNTLYHDHDYDPVTALSERVVRYGARGEKSGVAKLTNAKVRKIKQELASGEKRAVELAREYGVTSTTISDIKRGKLWKSVF